MTYSKRCSPLIGLFFRFSKRKSWHLTPCVSFCFSFEIFFSHLLSGGSSILLFCENLIAIHQLLLSVIRHLCSELMDLFALSAFRWSQLIFWKCALNQKWYPIPPEDKSFLNACLAHCVFHRRENPEDWVQWGGILPKMAWDNIAGWRVPIFIILVAKRQGHGTEDNLLHLRARQTQRSK